MSWCNNIGVLLATKKGWKFSALFRYFIYIQKRGGVILVWVLVKDIRDGKVDITTNT